MNTYIESTNINVGATMRDIEALCDDAKQNHYAAVCVAPYYVSLASELLKNSPVEVATIISYPFGLETTAVKSYEAIDAVQNGATEIGMMLNTAAIKNKDFDYVQEEIEEIRDSIDGKVMKLMIDTSTITDEELISIIHICNDTFIHYIEIIGEVTEDIMHKVQVISEHKNELLGIKVNTSHIDEEALSKLIDANVSRIGVMKTSSRKED